MYFEVREMCIMFILAIISTLLNVLIPMKELVPLPGPAAGMAIFGGFTFVFWIVLSYKLIKKKFAGIVTSLLVASFCLLISPWYGVITPVWFSIYGILSLLAIGIFSELKSFVGGGIGNLACLLITWIALAIHTGTSNYSPVLAILAFISGCIGHVLADLISKFIKI